MNKAIAKKVKSLQSKLNDLGIKTANGDDYNVLILDNKFKVIVFAININICGNYHPETKERQVRGFNGILKTIKYIKENFPFKDKYFLKDLTSIKCAHQH